MFLKASPPKGRASESGGGCGEEKRFGGKESPQPPTRFRERSERNFPKSGIFDKMSSSGVIKILQTKKYGFRKPYFFVSAFV